MKQVITLTVFFATLFCFSQTNKIDSLTVNLAYQKQDSAKVDTSLLLVKALYDSGYYQKAQLYIDQTERLAKSLDYKKGTANVFYYKALIYTKKNDYYNAFEGLSKSLSLYAQIKDDLGIAKVKNSLGLLEIKRGNYRAGLEYSLASLKTFENNNLLNELSDAYNNLAEAYTQTNQGDRALEFNLKALKVRWDLQDSTGIIQSNKNLGILYSKRREHRKAIEHYENILNLISDSNRETLKGEILPRIGFEYLEFNNYEKAADYLLEGLKLNRRIENDEGILRSLNALADLNLQRGNTNLARTQANEAYAIANQIDDQNQLLANYRLQKEIDSVKKNFQNAFFWQGKFYDLKTQLDKENAPVLPAFKEQINTDSTNNIINLAITENSEDKSEADDEHSLSPASVIPYVLGGILLLAIFTIVLVLYYKERKKQPKSTANVKVNETLELEIDRLLSQNKVSEERIENLEEINGVKDRLFSIVSHDLKDSISSIKAFIDLIKQGNISKAEFDNLIPQLSENADSAMELLYNLLNWSKSQMQNLEPQAEIFNIQDVFHNKMSLVEQKVEQKEVKLVDNSHRDFVFADRSMIEIVVQNLITNAVKFTKKGDVITVSNSDNYGKCLITVEDTGVGISKENISKLFKKGNFTTTGTSNEKGTGLGLTICKELVELNDGKIWVESKVGVGSKFFVEIPKMEAK